MKVLIIEDSPEVVEAFLLCLESRWPEVSTSVAAEGRKGMQLLKADSFDLVILDLNLPDIDGLEILKQARSFSDVPIIIVTVRGNEGEQAKGLEMGADDYIVKPFKARDLIARLNAVLRRTQIRNKSEEKATITRGKLTLKLTTNEAFLGNQISRLTPTECSLLYMLMKNADHTVNSEAILKEVWGEVYQNNELLRSYIRRLRDKLQDNPPQIILTERGEGYRFVSPR